MIYKKKLYVHDDSGEITFAECNCEHFSWFTGIFIEEIEIDIEYEAPTASEMFDKKITKLQSAIEKERADSCVKVEKLQAAIQSLMALEVSV